MTKPIYAAWISQVVQGAAIIPSQPITITGKNGVLVKNISINTNLQNAIKITGCQNVVIDGCYITAATYRSISIEQCMNVTVKNCFFDRVAWGLYLNQCSGTISIDHNWTCNIWGMNPNVTDGNQGVGIMINNSTVPGAKIEYNYLYCNISEGGSMQDVISNHNTAGNSTSPIKINSNYIYGGGPSSSSGGILCGDNGGSYIIAENNVLVNPGQYGIASMGVNNTIRNNKIYAKPAPFTNVGITVWQPSPTIPCSANSVTGNKVKWFRQDGSEVPNWLPNKTNDPRGCVGTIDSGNDWHSSEVGETMPPPAGVIVPILPGQTTTTSTTSTTTTRPTTSTTTTTTTTKAVPVAKRIVSTVTTEVFDQFGDSMGQSEYTDIIDI